VVHRLDELVSMVKKQLKHPTVTKDRLKLYVPTHLFCHDAII
jgi:hypothetical protein